MSSYPQRAIARLAARQNGNVTRAQLLELGVGEGAIRYKLRHGQLHREHAGVYSVGRPARTPIERATAAVLACGDGALLSHASALALWGLATRWPRQMHVTAPADRRPSGIVVHQSRTLIRADARVHLGVHVTSPARTLHDCAPTLSHRALTRAVNDALRSPFMSRAQLEEMAQRGKRLLQFTVAPTGPTRSDFEDIFLEFCAQHDLPRPLVNAHVIGYEVDALFADQRLIVELDSWGFHADRDAFENDRHRDADLLAAGYVVIRITWQRLTQAPATEAARLRTILTSRASAQPARSAPAS